MSFSFPSSPSVGQTSAQNGRTYTWTGYAWELVSNVTAHASSHASTGSDPVTIASSQVSGLATVATTGAYSALSGLPTLGTAAASATTDFAAASHTHAASAIVSGTISTARLGSGTADATTFLRGDSTWASASVPDPYDLGTYPLITISSQPSSATVTVGQSATFSVTATATLPSATVSYQWQQSTDSGSTWSNVSGATSSSLSYSNLQTSSNGYRYRCKLIANLSQVFTSSATLTVSSAFSATAVLLTSGTSYTVPNGATTMKAWAVGGGGNNYTQGGGAGGTAYKTWSVTGGSSVTYAVGARNTVSGGAGTGSTVTYGGTTITGNGGGGSAVGGAGGSYSGGDGGATGGDATTVFGNEYCGGAVGGNSASLASCKRRPMTDVSGLQAALTLAGQTTTESCGATGAFGSSGYDSKFSPSKSAGIGGGGSRNSSVAVAGNGAVVLYFT